MDLSRYRGEFPVTQRLAYLDHAAVAPVSRRVADAVRSFYQERLEGGELYWSRWEEVVAETRRLAAELLHALPEEVALLRNTSEGINMVALGLPWRRGDSVVTTDLEFPSNLYPWLKLRERGVKVRIVKHRVDGTLPVSDIEARIDGSTRLVAISHIQYGNGYRVDLKELYSAIDRRCLLLVDAVQSLGAVPVESRYADFISAGGHKWLLAPFGGRHLLCEEGGGDGSTRRQLDQCGGA